MYLSIILDPVRDDADEVHVAPVTPQRHQLHKHKNFSTLRLLQNKGSELVLVGYK